jgi:hypothetical protein
MKHLLMIRVLLNVIGLSFIALGVLLKLNALCLLGVVVFVGVLAYYSNKN